MIAIIGLIIFGVLCFAPSLWAQRILRRYRYEREDFPGTGGEFARHLLDIADLQDVVVEPTQTGDHYDPTERVVRLSHDHFAGKSLTAVAVAAHEVGHALQDRDGYQPLKLRTAYARYAMGIDRVARGILLLAPLMIAVSPKVAIMQFALGVFVMLGRVLLHVITLPVEYDASFNRALPILKGGNYIADEDMEGATSILRACAYTYVAAALLSLINVARWLRIGR